MMIGLPRLSDFDAMLDGVTMEVLGETIQYRLGGSSEWLSLAAIVDYSDQTRSIEGVDVVDQNIRVSILKSSVPEKPSSAVRIRLAKCPGRTFKPLKPGSDESGSDWVFDVKDMMPGG